MSNVSACNTPVSLKEKLAEVLPTLVWCFLAPFLSCSLGTGMCTCRAEHKRSAWCGTPGL